MIQGSETGGGLGVLRTAVGLLTGSKKKRKDGDDDSYGIECHPRPGFLHLAANHRSGPWENLVEGGYHVSLLRVGEVTPPALAADLENVITGVDGQTGPLWVHDVDDQTSTHIISWWGLVVGGVWSGLNNLRAAPTHPGPATMSA